MFYSMDVRYVLTYQGFSGSFSGFCFEWEVIATVFAKPKKKNLPGNTKEIALLFRIYKEQKSWGNFLVGNYV